MTGTAEARTYVFGNRSIHSLEQHRCLSELCDPLSIARLGRTGVGDGWRCLEVGSGGGSVARWLAQRVVPRGEVIATDLEPQLISGVPGLTVRRHDIASDPLPEAGFDLIHARLVLQHVPRREEALTRLVGALRPGGWLQIDEFDVEYSPVLLAPDEHSRRVYECFQAAKARVFRAAGCDPTWGRRVAQRLSDLGLVDVDPLVHIEAWRGGSAGALLQHHHTLHARDGFLRDGMTEQQLADVRRLLTDPSFQVSSPVRHCVQARRPAG
ncbi:MAG: class I SAM-dependent methyltransferase [Stackebrandtia sp.]